MLGSLCVDWSPEFEPRIAVLELPRVFKWFEVTWWWSSKTFTSSSWPCPTVIPGICLSKLSVSRPIFVKSMRVLAELIAYRCFLAKTIILKDCAIDQKTRSSSSLISSDKLLYEIMVIRNRMLHPKTIRKSSLFQWLCVKYFLNPAMRTRKAKSTLMVMFRSSSTAIKVGESATLKPSTTVVTTSKLPVASKAI